jgi:hypothetical protein
MSSRILTPADIIAIHKKLNGARMLHAKVTDVKKNKNTTRETYYIPLEIVNLSGERIPFLMKFVRQVISSNAKISKKTDLTNAKDVIVTIRKINKDDLSKTEYPVEKHEFLMKSNEELVTALNILADEYERMVSEDILKNKSKTFVIQNRKICSFRQMVRKAGNDEEGNDDGNIKLENPLFRVKIAADFESKKLGYLNFKTKKFVYTVFDTKKSKQEMKAKNLKTAPAVVARVKIGDSLQDLNLANAGHFITYMSLTGGSVTFDSICLSNMGISCPFKFKELHVFRHKPLKMPIMNDDDMNDMEEFGTGVDNTDEVEIDEPQDQAPQQTPTGKKSSKNSQSIAKALADDDEEVTMDDALDEPDENDTSDPEETTDKTVVTKKTSPKDSDEDEEPVKSNPKVVVKAAPVKKTAGTGGNLKAGSRKKPTE